MNPSVLEVLRISLKLWSNGNRCYYYGGPISPLHTGWALGFTGETPDEMIADIDRRYPPKSPKMARKAA